MLPDSEIVTTLLEIKGDVKALNIQVASLKTEVGDLKKQNEDRRTAIDTVATALRNEADCNIKALETDLKKLEKAQTTLEANTNYLKWVLAPIALTLLTLGATRIWNVVLAPELNHSQFRTEIKK